MVNQNIETKEIMAIAIRPIPVLTGSTAERFETMLEETRHTAFTDIPQSVRDSFRSLQERSRNVILKMPVR